MNFAPLNAWPVDGYLSGDVPPVVLPATLEQAIVDRFNASMTLVGSGAGGVGGMAMNTWAVNSSPGASSSFIDGGISYMDIADTVEGRAPRRYVVFFENGGIQRHFTTADFGQTDEDGGIVGSPSKSVEYRFLCHGKTAYDGLRMRDYIRDIFRPDAEPLEWARGITSVMIPGDEGQDPQEYVDSYGSRLLVAFIDIRFTFDRYPTY